MDHLWTPWRYAYISAAHAEQGCILCEKPSQDDDRAAYILHRAEHCYLMLNTFPYTSGHVMITPYEHVDQLQKLVPAAAAEMMALVQKVEGALREAYQPDGINLGMNIGKAAGAGVAGHIHMHVLPRWFGDGNFMWTIGETRVMPETLDTTLQRLQAALKF